MKMLFFYLRNLITLCVICLTTLTACNSDNDRKKYDENTYFEVLSSLVEENTDLYTISGTTNVHVDLLIKAKYGIISENKELTNYLRDLKYAYDQDDYSTIECLKKQQEFNIDTNVIGKPIPIKKYKSMEYQRNEEFQLKLPHIGQDLYAREIREFIDDKYSFIGIFKNLWDYVTSSKEEYIANYSAEFQHKLLAVDINQFMEERINAYARMLVAEHRVLYNANSSEGNIMVNMDLEKLQLQLDTETQEEIIKHATIDLYDFAVSIIEETLIAFVIWAIFAIFIEIAIEKAVSNAIRELTKSLSWKKDRGILNNLLSNGLKVFGSHCLLEEEKKKIRSKYRTRQALLTAFISIITLVWGYFYVTKPSIEIEIGIEQKINEQTNDYFKDLNIWVLTGLNNITKALS